MIDKKLSTRFVGQKIVRGSLAHLGQSWISSTLFRLKTTAGMSNASYLMITARI